MHRNGPRTIFVGFLTVAAAIGVMAGLGSAGLVFDPATLFSTQKSIPPSQITSNAKPTVEPVDYRTSSPDVFAQTAKLTASDGSASDEFGFSVAISGDTAVVGASRDDTDRGSAYVYIRNGSVWSFQQKLTGSDGVAEDSFGFSVAISGDTIAVGSYADDALGSDQGSVFIFRRSGAIWTQEQKLTAGDGAAGDQLGVSVSISGETVVAGALGDDSFRGSAYVFTRSGSVWTQQQKLTADDGIGGDNFGVSVSISGETAIVGADQNEAGRGAVYVFVRNGTVWTVQQKIIAADGLARDNFGNSVSLDGHTTIVGAVNDETASTLRGSAYVFARSGTTWTQQTKLLSEAGNSNNNFGTSVTVGGDYFAVGANGNDAQPNGDQGAVYIFARSGSLWFVQPTLMASDAAADDNFGVSVALSGNTLAVGAYLDDAPAIDQGSAYIFVDPNIGNPTPTPSASPSSTPTATPTPASNATVSGLVTTPDGRGLRNATVVITDSAGVSRSVMTSSFGFYSFSDMPTGATYTIRVRSRRYRFADRQVTVTGDTQVDFVGLE